MIGNIIQALIRIRNYERIPRLPRGYLAGEYDIIDADARRVLARFGARDPIGMKRALRRAKVDDVDQLVERLEHYTPKRRLARRIVLMLGRINGGSESPPHRQQIMQATKASSRDEQAMRRRIKNVKRAIEE